MIESILEKINRKRNMKYKEFKHGKMNKSLKSFLKDQNQIVINPKMNKMTSFRVKMRVLKTILLILNKKRSQGIRTHQLAITLRMLKGVSVIEINFNTKLRIWRLKTFNNSMSFN